MKRSTSPLVKLTKKLATKRQQVHSITASFDNDTSYEQVHSITASFDNDTSYDSEYYLKPICHEYMPMTGGQIRSSHMYENALDAGYNQSLPMINEMDEHNTI